MPKTTHAKLPWTYSRKWMAVRDARGNQFATCSWHSGKFIVAAGNHVEKLAEKLYNLAITVDCEPRNEDGWNNIHAAMAEAFAALHDWDTDKPKLPEPPSVTPNLDEIGQHIDTASLIRALAEQTQEGA